MTMVPGFQQIRVGNDKARTIISKKAGVNEMAISDKKKHRIVFSKPKPLEEFGALAKRQGGDAFGAEDV